MGIDDEETVTITNVVLTCIECEAMVAADYNVRGGLVYCLECSEAEANG